VAIDLINIGTSPNDNTGEPVGRAMWNKINNNFEWLDLNKQPLAANLTAYTAVTLVADSLTIGSGPGTIAQVTFGANTFPGKLSAGNLQPLPLSDFSAAALSYANAPAWRVGLGLGTMATQDANNVNITGGTITGVPGLGDTDLTFTRDATTVTVESSNGTDAVLPAATSLLAGVMPAADKEKLNFLTITGPANADYIGPLVSLSGMPALSPDLGTFLGTLIPDNSTVKQALQLLESAVESFVGGLTFAGTWDATTADPSAALNPGEFYRVSVAGTTAVTTLNLGVVSSWAVGDFLLKDNTNNVHKLDNTDPSLVFTSQTHLQRVLSNGGSDVTFLGATPDTSVGADDGIAGLLTSADKLRLDTTQTYQQVYGDGVALSFPIAHSLASRAVHVTVIRESDGLQYVPEIVHTSVNVVTLTHTVAPTAGQYRVIVSRIA
jgi:hypothetical protein